EFPRLEANKQLQTLYFFIFTTCIIFVTAVTVTVVTKLFMKFYNRKDELDELKHIQHLTFSDHSRMTVVTGRRRIGKTSLVMKAVEGTPTVYFFIGRKNETALCSELSMVAAQALNTYIPEGIQTFRSLFQFLMELGTRRE